MNIRANSLESSMSLTEIYWVKFAKTLGFILSAHTIIGHFAVKKIAVGQSHSYLLKILREVYIS